MQLALEEFTRPVSFPNRSEAVGLARSTRLYPATWCIQGKAASVEMDIKGNWDRLSSSTQQWLIDNPGSAILPRTIAATIFKEIGRPADRELHGGSQLSQEDRDFILDKARSATS